MTSAAPEDPLFFPLELDGPIDDLAWDMPTIPSDTGIELVYKNAVVLIRHFYADTGNSNDIFKDYLDSKIVNS